MATNKEELGDDKHIGDSHCHLNIDCTIENVADIVTCIVKDDRINKDRFFSLMTTNHIDIEIIDKLVDDLLKADSRAVLPYFGIHPWYSHLFSDGKASKADHYNQILKPSPSPQLLNNLPDPINLDEYLLKLQHLIGKHGMKVGIGELGLDKAFRIPTNGYYGSKEFDNENEEVKLSACRVDISHQRTILTKQLSIANCFKLPVSLHCVKAHGMLFDTITKHEEFDQIPSIILHSYSGSIDQAKQWVRTFEKSCDQKLYFSLSNYINGVDNKLDDLNDLVGSLGDNQILIETDFGIDKFVGKVDEYLHHLQSIFDKIAYIKQWQNDENIVYQNQRLVIPV